jgi:uncharacterized membrane protein
MKGNAAIIISGGLVAVVLACTTLLLALGHDPTPLLAAVGVLVSPVIGAILSQRLNEIKEHVNGNTSRLLGIAEKAAGRHAESTGDEQ